MLNNEQVLPCFKKLACCLPLFFHLGRCGVQVKEGLLPGWRKFYCLVKLFHHSESFLSFKVIWGWKLIFFLHICCIFCLWKIASIQWKYLHKGAGRYLWEVCLDEQFGRIRVSKNIFNIYSSRTLIGICSLELLNSEHKIFLIYLFTY